MVGLPSGRRVLDSTAGFGWGAFAGKNTLPLMVVAVVASFEHCVCRVLIVCGVEFLGVPQDWVRAWCD